MYKIIEWLAENTIAINYESKKKKGKGKECLWYVLYDVPSFSSLELLLHLYHPYHATPNSATAAVVKDSVKDKKIWEVMRQISKKFSIKSHFVR